MFDIESTDFDSVSTKGVLVNDGMATVNKSTFTDNNNNDGSYGADGGAILNGHSQNGDLYISNSEFTGNQAKNAGGAIANANDSILEIVASTFTGNSAGTSGGALNVAYNSEAVITSGAFHQNTAATIGGGLYIGGGTTTLKESSFTENTATTSGGGIAVNASGVTLTIEETNFTENNAADGSGGGLYIGGGTSTLTDVTFTENTATANGGAIAVNDSGAALTVNWATFSENIATTGNGGAIHAQTNSTTIKNTTFDQNHATVGSGGALNVAGGTTALTNVSFTDNTAGIDGGAINFGASVALTITGKTVTTFSGNKAQRYGGAISLNNAGATLGLTTGASFSQNTAVSGGAIYTAGVITLAAAEFDANEATGSGGAVNIAGTAAATLTDMTFTDNTTGADGGALNVGGTATVTITGNYAVFSGNKAENGYGGALSVNNSGASLSLNADDLTLTNNMAMFGGLLYNLGTTTINAATISGNRATGGDPGIEGYSSGGAIFNDTGATLTLNDVSFSGNTTDYFGGAVYNNNGTVNLNVSAGKTISYSGNSANGEASSIYLNADAGETAALAISVGSGGELQMVDTMGGAATGTVSISKTGAGILSLAGANEFTAAGTGKTTFSLAAGVLHLYGAGESVTLADLTTTTITGDGSISLAGDDSTFSMADGTTITTGGTDNRLTAANFNLNGAATITTGAAVTDKFTLTTNLGGTGSLTKTGAGKLVFDGTGSIGGAVTLSAGTLEMAADSTLSASGLTIANGTALNVVLGDESSIFNISGGATIGATGTTLNFTGISVLDENREVVIINTGSGITDAFATITVAGAALSTDSYLTVHIRNSDDDKQLLAKVGLAWYADNNTAHGTFLIDSANESFTLGTGIVLADENANTTLAFEWSGKALTKSGAGTLVLEAENTYTGDTDVLGGAVRITNVQGTGNNSNSGGDVNISAGALLELALDEIHSGTYNKFISGNGSVLKSGAGTVTLTNTNVYTGGTTITGGLVNFSMGANLGAGNITLNGGGLQWATGTTTDISARLNAIGHNGGVFDTNDNNVTLTTTLTGTGDITKQGAGKLTLGFDQGYTSADLNAAGGTLVLTAAPDAAFEAVNLINSGSALDLTAMTGGLATKELNGDAGTAIYLGGNTLTVNEGLFNGVISGTGGLTKISSGTMVVHNNGLTYTGATDINEGVLKLTGNATLASSNQVTVGAGAELNAVDITTASLTVRNLQGGGNVVMGSKNLALQDGNFSGVISGTGGLAINSTGTVSLSGANTYTGATSVQTGTLALAGNGSIAYSTGVTVSSGATFDITGLTAASTLVKNLNGAGTVVLADKTLEVQTGSFGGSFSGTGTLIKVNSGDASNNTLTLTANLNHSPGSVAVIGGTLASTVDQHISALVVNFGAVLDMGGHDLTLRSGTIEGMLANVNKLALDGSAPLVIAADNTVAGLDTADGTLNIAQNTTLTVSGAAVLGSGSTLVVNSNHALHAANLSISTNAALGIGNSSVRGVIISSDNVITGDFATVLIAGVVYYPGAMQPDLDHFINNVMVQKSADLKQIEITVGDLVWYNTVPGTAHGVFNVASGDYVVNEVLRDNTLSTAWYNNGAGYQWDGKTLDKTGAGTLKLTGVNTYTGGSHVRTGTLVALNSNALGTGSVTVYNGAVLELSFDGDFANDMISTAGVINTSGDINLLGDHSAYHGDVNINAGHLGLGNNSYTVFDSWGAFIVNDGTTLNGNGSVGDLTVKNGGVLSPGNSIGTITVKGDALFEKGSAYNFEVGLNGDIAADLLDVQGKVTIDGGSLLHIGLGSTAADYSPLGTWTIITAVNGVDGTFDAYNSNYAFIDLDTVYEPNAVKVTITRNNKALDDYAYTDNQKSVADALNDMSSGTLYNKIITLPNGSNIADVYDQLSGEIHASAAGAIINQDFAFGRILRGRVADHDFVANKYPLWISLDAYTSTADSTFNTARARYTGAGISLGAETNLSDNLMLGAAFRYADNELKVWKRHSTADIESFNFALYGGWYLDMPDNGTFKVSFGAAYGLHNIDTKRNIVEPGMAQRLKADYDAETWQAFMEAAWNFEAMRGFGLEPYAGVAWNHIESEYYHERGDYAALNGKIKNQDFISSSLGVRGTFNLGDLDLKADISWVHNYGDRYPEARMAFADSKSFAIVGAPLSRDALGLSLGAEHKLSDNVSLHGGYDGLIGNGYQNHGGRLTLSISF